METGKERFIKLLYYIIKEMTEIDIETPWTPTEPGWWLTMMTLNRHIRNVLKEVEN